MKALATFYLHPPGIRLFVYVSQVVNCTGSIQLPSPKPYKDKTKNLVRISSKWYEPFSEKGYKDLTQNLRRFFHKWLPYSLEDGYKDPTPAVATFCQGERVAALNTGMRPQGLFGGSLQMKRKKIWFIRHR
ncbi:hypothetical protein [Prolixibacter sp. NT017]|uniref:hypothetical protein n=1 Tax=Prolixibacter sp. NT017 TaxID=2652390 RepID=UPI00129930CA|nr:hypothetical protein [Prolixibacter sp. NT017]